MTTTIGQVMTRGVEVIAPSASLQAAAQRMDELNVGALPVVDGDQLLGIITDRDITVRATAAGLEPHITRVSDVMTAHTRCCTEAQPVEEVLRQMANVQVRRLPVLDERQQLIGIVSLGDLVTKHDGPSEQALREISSPSEPDR